MSRLAQFLQETMWLITPERYSAILGAIEAIEAGRYAYEADERDEDPKPYLMVDGAAEPVPYSATRGEGQATAVLVVPFSGTVYPKLGGAAPLSGGVNLQETLQVMRRAVADPGIASIIGDFDTPGGMVSGVPEAASEIRAMRGVKPMTAVVNYQAASAGYYLASQFDEIVASPSSSLGSIGVVAQYVSRAKMVEDMGMKVQTLRWPAFKAEADGIAELSDEAVAFRMAQIRKMYDEFVANVAAGLRIKAEEIEEKFGQGRSLDAREAEAVGMAHRIATFDAVAAEHMTGMVRKKKPYRASREEKMGVDEPEVVAEAPAPDPAPEPAPTRTAEELAARWGIDTKK